MDKFAAGPLAIEAVLSAASMNGGRNCAENDCSMASGMCSKDGCLLSGFSRKETTEYQRLNFGNLG